MHMQKTTKAHCQSCGMPLHRDPQLGGTNKDGSRSIEYCSYCYLDGDFTFHGSVGEFQKHCKKAMIAGGHYRITAWLLTRGMKRLSRWKNTTPKTN